MYRGLKQDPHTDYQDNWIEKYIMFVAECIHVGMSEKEIITELQSRNVPDQVLSLLLIAGNTIYQDDINNYIGE